MDAQALAKKYGDDPNVWFGSVDKYMRLKSKPKYYNDPVVKYGYARGSEPVNYVEAIRVTYRDYRNLFEENPDLAEKGLDVNLIQEEVN
jgi:membrane-bound lytic murein transglycosylase F